MAFPNVDLKDNVFLSVESVKDWLKIKQDNTEYDNRLKRIMNMVTDLAEKYISGPIKTRTIEKETRDGDSSNTIVPSYSPIRKITEIRVDFNRIFDDSTIVSADNYILRGAKDLNIGVMGRDIVLRDDNNTALFGRIFTGSTNGSIQITYDAGWGDSEATIPYDLSQAVMMGIEYFYIVRENRELNVTSKGSNGQNYSRSVGLPQEVKDLLDPYRDMGIWDSNQQQKNTTVI